MLRDSQAIERDRPSGGEGCDVDGPGCKGTNKCTTLSYVIYTDLRAEPDRSMVNPERFRIENILKTETGTILN